MAGQHDRVIAITIDQFFQILEVLLDGRLTEPACFIRDSAEIVAEDGSATLPDVLQQLDHRFPAGILLAHHSVNKDNQRIIVGMSYDFHEFPRDYATSGNFGRLYTNVLYPLSVPCVSEMQVAVSALNQRWIGVLSRI